MTRSRRGPIVFDNQAYESAGGGRTHTANLADLPKIAQGAGYKNAVGVDSAEGFHTAVKKALEGEELFFIAARVEIGTAAVPRLPRCNGGEVSVSCGTRRSWSAGPF
jgi:thiamine pyrophosphate-dependent acetolactate synthase large subunit-like protein